MNEPPASPASSDISGVNRDLGKIVRENKAASQPQEQLKRAAEETAARPPYDSDIASKGNSQ